MIPLGGVSFTGWRTDPRAATLRRLFFETLSRTTQARTQRQRQRKRRSSGESTPAKLLKRGNFRSPRPPQHLILCFHLFSNNTHILCSKFGLSSGPLCASRCPFTATCRSPARIATFGTRARAAERKWHSSQIPTCIVCVDVRSLKMPIFLLPRKCCKHFSILTTLPGVRTFFRFFFKLQLFDRF